MNDNFKISLAQLYAELKKAKSPIVEYLGDGIEREVLVSKLQEIDLKAPEELIDLYEWHNGFSDEVLDEKTIGDLIFFHLGFFPNFEMSIETYLAWSPRYWPDKYFPVFESGGGDYYLLNCDRMHSDFGSIFFFSPSDYLFHGVISIFDSLEAMVESITACYVSEVYIIKDGDLVCDRRGEVEIFKKLNLQSRYWKLF